MSLFSFRRLRLIAGIFLWCAAGLAARGQADPVSGFTVTPAAREQSRVFYNTVYAASEGVPSGWTGNVSGGVAGTTSQAFKDAVQRRVNYFRAMAGVPAHVVFSDAFNAADQQAALMESANDSDSHYPTPDFVDYTAAGASADASSNLVVGASEEGSTAVAGYIAEPGSNNAAVGHRRWLLYPPQTTMGTGDVDTSGATLAANALWVTDTASFASPAPAPRDGFVAWPPPGYVPYALIPARWSFSVPGADFSAATVTMIRQGAPVAVQLETQETGYGDNTLVWVPDGVDAVNPPAPVAPAGDVPTTVTVSNVLVNGTPQSFTYTVTSFDPGVAGADTVLPVIGGPANPATEAANTYTFNAVPNATGYRWSVSALSPLSLDLDAENGPGDVTISPAGASLVSTANPATGNAGYLFNSNPAETLTLNAVFMPTAGSALTFDSELSFASPDETARVQISTDGGTTWTDLYTISGTGTGAPTETAYGTHVLDLSSYAGESCTLRFGYAFSGTGIYFPPDTGVGWYVDNIVLAGTQTVAAPVTADVPAGQTQFDFTPAASGDYALQVLPVFFGAYTADAGPMTTVAAADGSVGVGPLVTVVASVPLASVGGGTAGAFTLTRAGSDLSAKIVVRYLLKGSARNGQDFVALSGKAKLKPGRASVTIPVVPMAGGGTGKVKLVLQAGSGYSLGVADSAAVKIKP